jgi:YHS domain-containing protein
VSILAEIIQSRRSEKVASPETEVRPGSAGATEARDPICGMRVKVATARYRSEVSGQLVYFCCGRCKETFDRNSERGSPTDGRL